MADRDIAALAWTGLFKANTLFKYVPLNGEFRMNAEAAEVYTKTSERGWYRDAAGRKFRTGVRTAVYVAPKQG